MNQPTTEDDDRDQALDADPDLWRTEQDRYERTLGWGVD